MRETKRVRGREGDDRKRRDTHTEGEQGRSGDRRGGEKVR